MRRFLRDVFWDVLEAVAEVWVGRATRNTMDEAARYVSHKELN